MRRVWLLLAAGWAASPVQAEKVAPLPSPVPLQRSLSASRQFVIYHGDGTLRAKVARRVDDIRTLWLETLRLDDTWNAPIIIQLLSIAPAGAPKIRTGLYLADGRDIKIQIDVFNLSVLGESEFAFEVYRALCLELMYRDQAPKEGKSYLHPPDWLLEGFVENAKSRSGEGIAPGLYEMIVKSGPPPKLEQFLKERPEMMDATTRAIYRARSLALLHALLAGDDGPANLVRWISSLNKVNPSDAGKLLANFPALAADRSLLSKQWALSLADASATNRAKPLTMAETMRTLALILNIGTPLDMNDPDGEKVSGPMAFPVIARTKVGKYVMGQKSDELLTLQFRAHPLLRPIVEEYQLIAAELAKKPKSKVEKRLSKNMELQQALTMRCTAIEDYLNWFEAAKLDTPSETFDVILEMPSQDMPPRTDPIGRHMNDLEARGW